jgi:hypothetical protein
MGSKRFKGHLCVYCVQRDGVVGDHVFARSFFLPGARKDLPQVPACEQCNDEKGRIEHHLATVLPFGGRHTDAPENLKSQVPARLSKNNRLAQELATGRGLIWEDAGRIAQPAITLPFDSEPACRLFALVARGLAWHHWRAYLQAEHVSHAMFLSKFGCESFDRFFGLAAVNRVEINLGDGTVRYRGVQAKDIPECTLWRIHFYGGLMLSGDEDAPNEISTEIGAITGTAKTVYRVAGVGQ